MKLSRRGLTMIEVLIGSAFFLIIVAALFGVYIFSMDSVMRAQEINVVADDLADILEKSKSVAFSDLTTVFPDGAAIDMGIIGGLHLRDEAIVVTYPNGVDSDPLQMQVTVSWTSNKGKPRQETFKTIRTSRL